MRRMVRGTRLVDVKRPEYDAPLKTIHVVTMYADGKMFIDGVEMFKPVEEGCVQEFPMDSRMYEKIIGTRKKHHFWSKWF